MMAGRVVITGLGVVAPNGIGKNAVWENSVAGKNCIRPMARFDVQDWPVQVAGEISEFVETDFIPSRQAHKLDIFTKYALAASDLAIKDSALDWRQVNRERVGVFIGNCFYQEALSVDKTLKLYPGIDHCATFDATEVQQYFVDWFADRLLTAK